MLRAIVPAVLMALLGACSSSSSNNPSGGGAGGPEKPEPDPGASFVLGGTVSGLSGQLILSNGLDNEFAVIARNGVFAFPRKVPAGELYNVRVESRPRDQICEVINSRNFLVRDTDNVRVYCARAVERPVVFNRPVNLSLSRLVLSSNYQRLGAVTSPALRESGNSLQVFDNSYVALGVIPPNASEPEPILLAHVHDMQRYLAAAEAEKQPIHLDLASTVEALLLLEPTIATALMERAGRADAELDTVLGDLIGAVATTPEYQALSDKIHSLISAQKTLVSHGAELNEPLHALVRRAAEVLLENTAQVHFPRETVSGSAMEIGARPQPAASDLWLDFHNHASRTVALQSTRFTTTYLARTPAAAGAAMVTSLRIAGGIPAQESLQLAITGPGALGTVPESRRAAFHQAFIRSGAEQHFFPSINLMLGLLDPLHFTLNECLQTEYNLAVAALQNLVSDVTETKHYSAAYNKVFDGLRGRFIGSASDQKLLQEMFACEKFGVGSYIETQDKLQFAKSQVKDMLRIARAAYSPATNHLELFADPGMTLFTASVAATAVDTTWSYSNKLVLRLAAAATTIAPGQAVRLQAGCLDPSANNAPVACDMEWDFGDGMTRPAQTVPSGVSEESYSYAKEGSYRVVVGARRPQGVQVVQSLNIAVQTPKPRIQVKKSDGAPLGHGVGTLDFGLVTVGGSSVLEFIVTNEGAAPLLVDDIVSSDSAFSATPSGFTLPAKESRLVRVEFAPVAAQKYLGRFDILNNGADLDRQIFQLGVKGEGYRVGSPANGGWNLEQNGVNSSFVVQRAKVDYAQDGRLVIRVFGSNNSEFPQLVLNVPGYLPGLDRTYTLDDTADSGCHGSLVLDAPENTYCTSTHPAVTQPLTGTVQVTNQADDQKLIRYEFDAALNTIACGKIDVSECPRIHVEGTAAFGTVF